MNKHGKINIAFVIDEIPNPNGGTEGQLMMLVKKLDRSKFSPHLICLRDSEWLTGNNYDTPVTVLDIGRLLSLNSLKKLFVFRKYCRDNAIDIVQTFFMDANIFGTLAAKFAGCRIIISSRRNAGYSNTRIYTRFLRFIRRWTDFYLTNSMAVAQMTIENERVQQDRIHIIYNGLELERFRIVAADLRNHQRKLWGIAENEILVGSVANLRAIKNIDFLIRSAAVLCREFPRLRFVVVGEGPEQDKLQGLIDSLGISGRFLLAGRFPDVLPCLAAFDIAVLCSLSESFSNSIIEYMAAGLPVIVSDVGGNNEAVEHEKTGFLYGVGDDMAFQNFVRRLINDRNLVAQLGKQAREKAFLKYQAANSVAEHENFYLRIAEQKNKG